MTTPTVERIAVAAHITGSDVPLASPGKGPLTALYQTVVLTSNNPVEAILNEDPDREIAFILPLDNDIVIGPSKAVVAAALNTQSQESSALLASYDKATSVTATQLMAETGVLAAGTYDVYVTVGFAGTAAAAADLDNLALFVGSTEVVSQILYEIPGDTTPTSVLGPFEVTVPEGGAAISLQVVGLGTVGTTYRTQISAVNTTAAGAAGQLVDPPTPNGTLIPARLAMPWPIKDNQAVWAGVTTTAINSRISVAAVYRTPRK